MITIIWIPLATAFAAIIGGAISLIVLVISKENKISELRQEWIEAFRSEASEFITSVFLAKQRPQGAPYCSELHEKISINVQKMILRLNPGSKDVKSVAVLVILNKTKKLLNEGNIAQAKDELDGFRSATQQLLKGEWERVKAGEPFFRYVCLVCKWIIGLAILVVAIATILSSVYLWQFY